MAVWYQSLIHLPLIIPMIFTDSLVKKSQGETEKVNLAIVNKFYKISIREELINHTRSMTVHLKRLPQWFCGSRLSTGDPFQTPQWAPNIVDSTETCCKICFP